MRARNIKPGFFLNDDLAELSIEARLFFIGLWLCADREGYVKYKPKRLKAQILPYDSSNVEKLLDEIIHGEFAQIYYKTLPDGNKKKAFLFIPNFTKHQHPHKNEKASEIADLIGSPEITGQAPESNGTNPAERGKRKEERGKINTAVEEKTRQADSVIDYLNEKTKKQFRHSPASRDPIIARLNDKATVEECKTVIDNKIADEDFKPKYLQPSTLFRKSNFENYLNQSVSITGKTISLTTCDACGLFCSPGSPDKCNQRGNMTACSDYKERAQLKVVGEL